MGIPTPLPPEPGANPYYHSADLVYGGWNWFQGLASQLIYQTTTTLNQLSSVEIEPVAFDADFQGNYDPTEFIRPPSPGQPPSFGPIAAAIPGFAGATEITIADLDPAPPDPGFDDWTYSPVDPPGDAPEAADLDIPELDAIVVPPPPDLPPVGDIPDLYAITLPDSLPAFTIDEFDGVRPPLDLGLPNVGFVYAEDEYVATLALEVKAKLSSMLLGGTGLPVAIEEALFDRMRDREDKAATRAVQQTVEEWATRGFVEPTGALAARVLEVRQNNQAAIAGANREIAIQRHQQEIEQLRFAVAQGIALEQVLIAQSDAINSRALQAAQVGSDLALKVLDARVALYNASLEAFKADAQVYVEKVRAKQAEVELYAARINAERVKGEINESIVRAYVETIRARDAMAQVYRSQIEGVRAIAEVNSARVETVRAQVAIFAEEVRAYGAEVDAYRSKVEGQLGNVRAMESLANVYASRVQAHRAKADVTIEHARAQVAAGEYQVNAYRASVEGAIARVRAEAENAAATASSYRARADIYTAEAQVAQAESAAGDREVQLRIEAERARVDAALRAAQVRIDQARNIAGIYIESLRGHAQAQSQLASSALNGVNLAASINGGANVSESFNFNYSGEL